MTSEQMSERHEEHRLSTADMAAAARAPEQEPAEPPEAERAAVVTDGQREMAAAPTAPLLPNDVAEQFRSRWDSTQTGFVDEPRQAVEQADALVAEIMQRLASVFADERSKLEQQWSRGEDVSTEDLRVALQRYRSFFDRLLSV